MPHGIKSQTPWSGTRLESPLLEYIVAQEYFGITLVQEFWTSLQQLKHYIRYYFHFVYNGMAQWKKCACFE